MTLTQRLEEFTPPTREMLLELLIILYQNGLNNVNFGNLMKLVHFDPSLEDEGFDVDLDTDEFTTLYKDWWDRQANQDEQYEVHVTTDEKEYIFTLDEGDNIEEQVDAAFEELEEELSANDRNKNKNLH